MRVTVIADASYDANHLVGGYGYWIACERGKRPGGGALRGQVASSVIAEMMAICRALHDGLKYALIQAGDEVLLQTDCMGAINTLQTFCTAKMDVHTRSVVDVFDKLVKKGAISVRFRHVKGHTTNEEPRFAANRACDHRAKRAMREARTKLINGSNNDA